MRKYSIFGRIVCLLLMLAMVMSVLPAAQVSAAEDEGAFISAQDDGVTMLNNGETITLPIKINNFVNDGMLFEYLSSVRPLENAHDYYWEQPLDNGVSYVQLYPYLIKYGAGLYSEANGGQQLADKDGTTATIDVKNSLHYSTDVANMGIATGGDEYQRFCYPTIVTENGSKALSAVTRDETPFIRLIPDGKHGCTLSKGRAWTKLTTFADGYVPKAKDIRYAVIICRLPKGTSNYDALGVTINNFMEVGDANTPGNSSAFTKISKTANSNWQFVIIDLLAYPGAKQIDPNAVVNEVYLQMPIGHSENLYMDIAGVGYFPYYGDAEQFGYYGVTLGCKQAYFKADNSAFNLRSGSRDYNVSTTALHFDGVPEWVNAHITDKTKGLVGFNTFDTPETPWMYFGTDANDTDTSNKIGYALFGDVKGATTLGLLESALDENGRPVYKESVVSYFANLLRHSLCGIQEYPTDNNGWRNYGFVTGSSTNNGTNRAMFGQDSTGKPYDLGAALCKQLGVTKGNGVENQGTLGSYANSAARSGDLIGPWNTVIGNIHTWHDAAYALLHNLYVTGNDAAYDGDSYGEYEDTFQYLVMPKVSIKSSDGTDTTAYFFDSGYSYNRTDTLGFGSALDYNVAKKTITLMPDAEGKAIFRSVVGDEAVASYFPFLVTSGTYRDDDRTTKIEPGHGAGETNTPYYLSAGAVSRGKYLYTYVNRDFHYSMSGKGDFTYKRGLYFNFEGDDDVYVYINGQLVVDIGGTHSATSFKINLDEYVDWAWAVKNGEIQYKGKSYSALSKEDRARVDALALDEGGVYSFDFFYMERHGVGSNLRIITNIEITKQGLDVDKFAHQDGIEVPDNGMINAEKKIRYGFSITNNSENKMYRLRFSDPVIGVSMDWENGLVIAPNSTVTDEFGLQLDPKDLVITVSGVDANNNPTSITVTCADNAELMDFLTNLTSDDGTGSGSEETDTNLHSGSGLWQDATITIDGIYHTMTAQQRMHSSFRNYVVAEGDAGDHILRGSANHTIYQPGNPAYYHWVKHPIYVDNKQLYNDLVYGGVVDSASDLPALENMILMCTNSAGTQLVEGSVTNKVGGDVYLKINYTVPGSYMVYVTILDKTNEDYKMTLPITIYAVDTKESYVVLDYGLDSYLTDSDAIFDYELNRTYGDKLTGTVMSIADSTIIPSYKEYDESRFLTKGNEINDLGTLLQGSYANGKFTNARAKLDKSIQLKHNVPWIIEWKGIVHNNGLLFSLEESSNATGNRYLYLRKDTTNNYGLVSLGNWDGSHYDNYGVKSDAVLTAFNKNSTYKMYNVPASDGTNMVYLSIDGAAGIKMNTLWTDENNTTTANQNWISGKDFTFNYFGTTNHRITMTFDYLYVYEDGEQFPHNRWEATSSGLSNKATGKIGYVNNAATLTAGAATYANGCLTAGAATDNNRTRWKLQNTVSLKHNAAWELEFKVGNFTSSAMLMSSKSSNKEQDNTYIYLQRDKGSVNMGFYDPSLDKYINYAVDASKHIDGFNMSTNAYVFLLKNVLNPDGSNMVHLYVDGKYVGPLDTYSIGSDINNGHKSNGISGRDFEFNYIGGDSDFGFHTGTKLYYLEARMDTVLRDGRDIYEWRPGATKFTTETYHDATANQINFTNDSDGIVTSNNATFTLDQNNELKFEINDFMDNTYTAYIAMTIHEEGFKPTAIDVDGIDITSEVQMFKKVTVMPATVVYYEDDFVAIKYPETVKNQFTSLRGSSEDLTQSADPNENYGSDNTYDTNSDKSGGVLTTIKIENKDTLAYFDFTGTGFEVVARTNATDSATVKLKVYNQKDVTNGIPNTGANPIYEQVLITEFDNQNNGGSEGIYQVPIFRINDLQNISGADGTNKYTALISGVPAYNWNDPNWDGSKFDISIPSTYPPYLDAYLYLDGIRIYQPLGDTHEGYTDAENGAKFVEIRKAIVEDGTVGFVQYNQSDDSTHVSYATTTWVENYFVSVEGNVVSSVNDYLIQGPNNEVYMDGSFTNSALVFRVKEQDVSARGLQIAVRGIDYGVFNGADSTGVQMSLQYGIRNGDQYVWVHVDNITGSTEQYYTIPYRACQSLGDGMYQVVVRVKETSSSIPALASFSSLKLTGLELVAMDKTAKAMSYDNGELIDSSTGEAVNKNLYPNYTALHLQMQSNEVLDLNSNTTPEVPVGPQDPENTSPINVSGATLSMESEIFVNLYFNVQDLDVAAENMGLLVWNTMPDRLSYATADSIVPGAVYNAQKDRFMVRTEGIAAKNLADDVYMSVYAKLDDGSYVYSKVISYSPKTYALSRLENSDDAELKALCVAMLNYGAAAQEYFGYKTDALMNADLSEAQKALVSGYSKDMVADVIAVDPDKIGSFTKSESAFTQTAATVSLDGSFSINFYFAPANAVEGEMTFYYWNAADYQAADLLSAENCSGKVAMTLQDNGNYWANYTGIAAKEIDDTIYVCGVYESNGQTYCSGVIAYSLGNYCKNRAEDPSSTMQDLAEHTAVYGYYAKAYFVD